MDEDRGHQRVTIAVRYVAYGDEVWDIGVIHPGSDEPVTIGWLDTPTNRRQYDPDFPPAESIQSAEELVLTAAAEFESESPDMPRFGEEELSQARLLASRAGDPLLGIKVLVEARRQHCAVITIEP